MQKCGSSAFLRTKPLPLCGALWLLSPLVEKVTEKNRSHNKQPRGASSSTTTWSPLSRCGSGTTRLCLPPAAIHYRVAASLPALGKAYAKRNSTIICIRDGQINLTRKKNLRKSTYSILGVDLRRFFVQSPFSIFCGGDTVFGGGCGDQIITYPNFETSV